MKKVTINAQFNFDYNHKSTIKIDLYDVEVDDGSLKGIIMAFEKLEPIRRWFGAHEGDLITVAYSVAVDGSSVCQSNHKKISIRRAEQIFSVLSML